MSKLNNLSVIHEQEGTNHLVNKNNKILKFKNKLPQIILPKNKIALFIDWYNKDLRFQGTLPEAYSEGYLIIENDIMQVDISKCNEFIKSWAKQLNTTYREMEHKLQYYINCLDKVVLYFKYENKHMDILMYGNDNSIVSTMTFDIQEGENSKVDNYYIKEINNWDDTLNEFNFLCVVLLTTSLWYIATTTKTTKYSYNRKHAKYIYTDKEIKKVSKHKTISTPIYDLNKIKIIKVDNLIKRRKGWTYSHAFQVHGHYRHYKNGKVVFVNSYIKGKNKELQQQVITLDPKEV